MAVNISNKLSQKDLDRANKKKNPPEYEDGFEPAGEDSFETLFMDDIGTDNTGGSIGLSGMNNMQGGTIGGSGGSPTLGSLMNGVDGISNDPIGHGGMQGINGLGIGLQGLGMQGYNDTPIQRKKSKFEEVTDSAIDGGIDAGKALGKGFFCAFKALPNSLRIRTAEEWGYYGWKLGALGLIFVVACGVMMFIRPSNTAFKLLMVGVLNIGTSLAVIGFSAISILKGDTIKSIDLAKLQTSKHDFGMSQEDYEKAVTELDFSVQNGGDDFEIDLEVDEDTLDFGVDNQENVLEIDRPNRDYKDVLDDAENSTLEDIPYITRSMLVDTFKPLLELQNPDFSHKKEIPRDSDYFSNIEILLQKALAAVQGKAFEEITAELVSAEETTFVYLFRIERVPGLNKLDAIEREVVAYFREDSADDSVSARVLLEGDNYKIEVQKGSSVLVTYGDCLQDTEVEKYIRDTKNKLPFIAGVKANGELLLMDAKNVDSYMIAGKPRSGKSWSVLSYIMSFMLWNTPSDIQLLIIDPKDSVMFNTLYCMPHVRGLHGTSSAIRVLRDLIEVEGARRKKILKDNQCENIWDLKEKGIVLPVLLIVIDEIMTIIKSLSSEDAKEFNSLLIIVITQLPSLGIRPMIVPHRAQGVLDKTLRTNISFRSAVKAEEEVVKETLGILKWTQPLTVPGSAAISCDASPKPLFTYGVVVADSNVKNTELIKSVSRIFYKMGVEIPEMANLPHIFNRDLGKVKQILGLDVSNRVQMSANTVTDFEPDKVDDLLNYSRDDFEEEFNKPSKDANKQNSANRKLNKKLERQDGFENDFDNELDDEDIDDEDELLDTDLW